MTTNADRIRAMTDEDMALWLCDIIPCGHCPAANYCVPFGCGLVDWMKQEVADDD